MPAWTLGDVLSRVTKSLGRRADIDLSDASFWANAAYQQIVEVTEHALNERIAVASSVSGENRLKLPPDRTIVVGDGYTDLPLLNWTSIPVMMDRTGRKKKQFAFHRFYFITSIPEIKGLLKNLSTRNEQEIS